MLLTSRNRPKYFYQWTYRGPSFHLASSKLKIRISSRNSVSLVTPPRTAASQSLICTAQWPSKWGQIFFEVTFKIVFSYFCNFTRFSFDEQSVKMKYVTKYIIAGFITCFDNLVLEPKLPTYHLLEFIYFYYGNVFNCTRCNGWMGTDSLCIWPPHYSDLLFWCFLTKMWWILSRLKNWSQPWPLGVLFQAKKHIFSVYKV